METQVAPALNGSAKPPEPVRSGAAPSMSPTIAKLATALAKAQAMIKAAEKNSVNPHFRNRYADLEACFEACREALAKNGLAVLQPPKASGQAVTVTTVLVHESGEWIAEALTMKAQQDTPQAIGSAITYARRYGLTSMLGIASGEGEDDGNAASAGPKPESEIERQLRDSAKALGGTIEEKTISEAKKAGALVYPFGREKGKPVTEVTVSSLNYWAERLEGELDDPKWGAKNEATLKQVRAEIERRGLEE